MSKGEACASEKEHDFADTTTAWGSMALVIYTGTLSVGVSCESPHIRVLFAWFTNHLMYASQSAQMLFRFRELRSEDCPAHNDTHTHTHTHTHIHTTPTPTPHPCKGRRRRAGGRVSKK